MPIDADALARLSLGTEAARNLATTTKSVPQMQDISPRWLLRMLPWVQVDGGTYRVNRRLAYEVGGGRVSFAGDDLVPSSLREIPALRGLGDVALLAELAGRFERREVGGGETLARDGQDIGEILLIAHGKVARVGSGEYGEPTDLGILGDGDHLGGELLEDEGASWGYTARAATPCTVLALPAADLRGLMDRSAALREQVARYAETLGLPMNKRGEADIALASGHHGEPRLPGTYVAYELRPREYELSLAQTVLRVHSRVADLFSDPMDQTAQQVRLTVEALRERQEHELINNPDFGLLHNAATEQRIRTRTGPPTPEDLDMLLSMRRKTRLFLAHPRAIAAFGRECTGYGISPGTTEVRGRTAMAWRGVPVLPCDKIPITAQGTSAILAMRTGEDDDGVIGLHQAGTAGEAQPGLNVKCMGIDARAIVSYLITAYFSAAVMVPSALGVLENVEVSRR